MGIYGKCDACGTDEGIELAIMTACRRMCGPSNDCGENKKIRGYIKTHVHRDFAANVCEAFGITLIDVDGKTLDEGKKTCCVREECVWMDGKGENDHGCIGFVQDAIFAQIEDLPHEQGILVLKSALDLLAKN